MSFDLQFNAERHEYTLDGRIVPSVTQVGQDLLLSYAGVPLDILEHAAQRGTAVHRAVELYHQGDLDEASLHQEIAPYYYMYLKWWRDSKFVSNQVELRVGSSRYSYAGTLDLYGDLPKIKGALIDLKTSRKLMPAVGPQLAAYEQALRETIGLAPTRKIRRFGLHLHPEKAPGYTLVPQTERSDWNVFLSALTIHNWKKRTK